MGTHTRWGGNARAQPTPCFARLSLREFMGSALLSFAGKQMCRSGQVLISALNVFHTRECMPYARMHAILANALRTCECSPMEFPYACMHSARGAWQLPGPQQLDCRPEDQACASKSRGPYSLRHGSGPSVQVRGRLGWRRLHG